MQVDQLFTLQSLVSLQGAAAATLLVPHVIQALAGSSRYTELWRLRTAFVVAMALAFLTAAIAGGPALKWVVALFNGFLIFASAVGINETVLNRGAKVNRSWLAKVR